MSPVRPGSNRRQLESDCLREKPWSGSASDGVAMSAVRGGTCCCSFRFGIRVARPPRSGTKNAQRLFLHGHLEKCQWEAEQGYFRIEQAIPNGPQSFNSSRQKSCCVEACPTMPLRLLQPFRFPAKSTGCSPEVDDRKRIFRPPATIVFGRSKTHASREPLQKHDQCSLR